MRTLVLLTGLLVAALAVAPTTTADPLTSLDPCDSIQVETSQGDCGDLTAPPPALCWAPAIYPPTTSECQVGTVSLECAYGWTMVGSFHVPERVECTAQEGLTGVGLDCEAFTDDGGWRGLDCVLLGFNCIQVLWGIHHADVVVGGYHGCNFVVKTDLV